MERCGLYEKITGKNADDRRRNVCLNCPYPRCVEDERDMIQLVKCARGSKASEPVAMASKISRS